MILFCCVRDCELQNKAPVKHVCLYHFDGRFGKLFRFFNFLYYYRIFHVLLSLRQLFYGKWNRREQQFTSKPALNKTFSVKVLLAQSDSRPIVWSAFSRRMDELNGVNPPAPDYHCLAENGFFLMKNHCLSSNAQIFIKALWRSSRILILQNFQRFRNKKKCS